MLLLLLTLEYSPGNIILLRIKVNFSPMIAMGHISNVKECNGNGTAIGRFIFILLQLFSPFGPLLFFGKFPFGIHLFVFHFSCLHLCGNFGFHAGWVGDGLFSEYLHKVGECESWFGWW